MAAAMRAGQTWRMLVGILLAFALSAVSLSGSEAGTSAPPDGLLAARAQIVLETFCAECRDAGAAAIDMDALAHNPRLVMPKRPDSSRAYLRLFALVAPTRSKAADSNDNKRNGEKSENGKAAKDKANGESSAPEKSEAPPAEIAPAPAEIESVRDWIASLPARDEACRERSPITAAEVEEMTDRWMHAVGPADAADTRFLSLVHLWNACEPDDRLQAARTAAIALLAAVARNRGAPETAEIETLGDESALLVVRPSALAMPAAEWDRMTAAAPSAIPDIVPADWLAARLLAPPSETADDAMKFDGAIQQQLEPLARSWTQNVDLVRAAAERDVSARELAETLTAHENDDGFDARRLLNQSLSRAQWDNLNRTLDGAAAAAPREKPSRPDNEIDIVVWTDKPVYRPRDLVSIGVSVSKACHLTLIDVDREGKALVLFPNELHQDNLIAPGVAFQIPGNDAGYQFRLERAGEETLVAICQRHDLTPEGIAYDYEKQRFRILGDWRTFLRTAAEHEQEIRAASNAETNRRRRRGRSAPKVETPAAVAPAEIAEGRAAAPVIIEPASLARP
ncbi:DUF4384 domain-containing protein [Hyphomicrobium sp.]|uniref:DUF4384 domain-containing protein n=1 Tax=Hyphomicrobium sp. TaxID=82 RepID=UPI003F6E9809